MLGDDKCMLESAQSMLTQSEQVKKLCHYLFTNLKIQYYEYQQIDINGEGLLLLSDDRIYTDLLDQNSIGYEAVNANFSTYKKVGYYAHDLMDIKQPGLQSYLDILENYGNGHVFTINEVVYDKLMPMILSHTFSCRITDTKSFNQYYLENIRELKSFAQYFHQEVDAIKNKINRFKLTKNIEAKSKVIKKTKKFITLNKMEFNHSNNDIAAELSALSKRQREIIHWYVKGKNASETATVLNLSKRTIENHFYRLQKKYSCASKAQLLIKFIENNLITL